MNRASIAGTRQTRARSRPGRTAFEPALEPRMPGVCDELDGSGSRTLRTAVPSGDLVERHATIDVPGHGPLDVDVVHALPPISAAWTLLWASALEALPPPTAGTSRRLLAGDSNATLDHRAFREVLACGWVHAADADGAGLQPLPTFNGLRDGVLVPPVTLDHALVDRTVAVEAVSNRPLPGSDHRILIVRLRLPEP